jgi:hypothetical protein
MDKGLKNICYSTKMRDSATHNSSKLYAFSQTFCASCSTFLLSLKHGFILDLGDPHTSFLLQRLQSSIKM